MVSIVLNEGFFVGRRILLERVLGLELAQGHLAATHRQGLVRNVGSGRVQGELVDVIEVAITLNVGRLRESESEVDSARFILAHLNEHDGCYTHYRLEHGDDRNGQEDSEDADF